MQRVKSDAPPQIKAKFIGHLWKENNMQLKTNTEGRELIWIADLDLTLLDLCVLFWDIVIYISLKGFTEERERETKRKHVDQECGITHPQSNQSCLQTSGHQES